MSETKTDKPFVQVGYQLIADEVDIHVFVWPDETLTIIDESQGKYEDGTFPSIKIPKKLTRRVYDMLTDTYQSLKEVEE